MRADATTRDGFVIPFPWMPRSRGDEGYNVLRHAGAIYALSQSCEYRPDRQIAQTAVRAAKFMERELIAPVPGRENMQCVWSDPLLNGGDDPRLAKLGGTGLGLVALVRAEQLEPGSFSLEQLRDLGNFVLFMQQPDGRFYSRYIPSRGGYDTTWTSLFYPGEAALGLLHLYRLDDDEQWYRGALKALLYLANVRENRIETPPDHWALLATAELWRQTPPPSPDDRRRLLEHARKVTRTILDQFSDSMPDLLQGSVTGDGRTTPVATRVEGILAARSLLVDDQDAQLREEIDATATAASHFLWRSQVADGPHAGAMPRSIGIFGREMEPIMRKPNAQSTEARIDYVQHAVSAWIQYVERH